MKWYKRQALIGLVGLLICWLAGWPVVVAQESVRLWLGEPDLSSFPVVRVPLRTADFQGAPLTDLSRLSLRENSIPLDFELAAAPLGVDVIFVIDANADIAVEDENNGQTRLEKVVESINQFAGHFMSPDGLDRVSVIVPDENNEIGRFLIQDSANPTVVAQAVTAYMPDSLTATPLQAMMNLAVDQAAQNDNGRYQAILLFTDGGRIHRQLDYAELVTGAEAADLAVFAAILGARADQSEIDNVLNLTESTGGGYVHMPTIDDARAIYLTWQGQANQTQIVYQSLQTKSGQYPITISLDGARASTDLVLTLAAPEVALRLPAAEIRRLGEAHDSPLAALEPSSVDVPVMLDWPDELPRALTAVALQVNGVNEQTVAVAEIQPNDEGRLTLSWDVQFLGAGAYQLQAQVVDVLGYTAESEPVIVMISVERPEPPTPTPEPTPIPQTAPEPIPAISTDRLWLALGFSLLAGLIAAVLLWRRWRLGKKGLAEELADEPVTIEPVPEPPPSTMPLAASLEVVDGSSRFPLAGDSIILGRDESVAQIIFEGSDVARLHARIRLRDGRYWLYDEGSAAGTYLNYERLGLAPRQLHDGDQIQIGRWRLRFQLGLPFDEEE